MINSSNNVSEDKINIKNLVAFIDTNDKHTEKEIKETTPFAKASKQTKTQQQKNKQILGINLTKEVKDLHSENFKVLKRETEEGTRRWKNRPCSWTDKINVVKMAILPKATTDSLKSSSKFQCNSSHKLKKYFIWNFKRLIS